MIFLYLRLWDVTYNNAFKQTLTLDTLGFSTFQGLIIIIEIEQAGCRFDVTSEERQ